MSIKVQYLFSKSKYEAQDNHLQNKTDLNFDLPLHLHLQFLLSMTEELQGCLKTCLFLIQKLKLLI